MSTDTDTKRPPEIDVPLAHSEAESATTEDESGVASADATAADDATAPEPADVAIPTVASVRARIAELEEHRDEKLREAVAESKSRKADAEARMKATLKEERLLIDQWLRDEKAVIRKSHREAAVQWNRVLRSLEAEPK